MISRDTKLDEPFVGVLPYTRAHADVFHEREQESRALLETLLFRRVVMLYGDSSNGKSSLINAGLVPMLEHGKLNLKLQPEVLRVDREYAGIKVDRRPLADATYESLFKPNPERNQEGDDEFLLTIPELLEQLRDFVRMKREQNCREQTQTVPHILLILDQFEELHTYAGGRSAFDLRADRSAVGTDLVDSRARLAHDLGLLLRAKMEDDDTPPSPQFKKVILPGRVKLIDGSNVVEKDSPVEIEIEEEGETAVNQSETLPVKFLFVFREEYLVKLQALLPDLQTAASVRLPAIPVDRLKKVIEGPFLQTKKGGGKNDVTFVESSQASFFLAQAERLCLGFKLRAGGIGQNILTELQVVCSELWRKGEARTLVESAAGDSLVAAAINTIIERFFKEALDSLGADKALALDLLCEMVTADKTRNIASLPSLYDKFAVKLELAPAEPTRRVPEDKIDGVLQELGEKRFINTAERNGTKFYDIASEALIPWLANERKKRLDEVAAERIAQEAKELSEKQRSMERLAEATRQKYIGTMIAVGCITLAAWAWIQRQEAQENAQKAQLESNETKKAFSDLSNVSKQLTAKANEAAEALAVEKASKQALQEAQEQAEKKAREYEEKLNQLQNEIERAKKEKGTEALNNAAASIQRAREPRMAVFGGHRDRVNMAVFSTDGKFVATACADKSVRVWDIHEPGKVLLNTPASTSLGGVRAVAFVPGTDYLLTGSNGLSVRLFQWRRTPLGEVTQSDLDGNTVASIQFNPVDPGLLVMGRTGKCQLVRLPLTTAPKDWLADKQKPVLKSWEHASRKLVTNAVFSANGTTVVTSSDDGRTRVFSSADPYDPIADSHMEYHEPSPPPTRAAVFSPIDDRVVAYGAGTKVIHWRIGTFLRALDKNPGGIGHSGQVQAVAFSPDGKLLASVAADGRCIVWDVENGSGREIETGINGRLFGVDWKGDNLAICGEDGGLEIWQVAAIGEPALKFAVQAHLGVAGGIIFSPDGTKLLTWSGAAGFDNVPSAKGKATQWSTSSTLGVSDLTATLWDVEVAVNSGKTTRPIVASVRDAKAGPIPLYRVKDGTTRAIPGKENLWVWLGKIASKEQTTVQCRVFESQAKPADSFKENEMNRYLTQAGVREIEGALIGLNNPVNFVFEGKNYTLTATAFQTGLWQNDYLDLKLVER